MNQPPPLFDLAATELLPGTTLIEASAGTGKTFTIAGVFLRLIVEQEFSVSEILVVTFTEAATEELRARIRQTLADAAAAFARGASDDRFLAGLLERHAAERGNVLARLEQALGNFDEAPIFTIHGFCQRQLRDRAFESGALFDTELITDPSALLQEMADDYWRRHFYETSPLLARFVLKEGIGPEWLLPWLEIQLRHPALRVISPMADATFDQLVDQLNAAFDETRQVWRRDEAAIRAIFRQANEWAIGNHAKDDIIAHHLTDLERCFSDSEATPESFESLAFFSTSSIQKDTSKRRTPPAHRFFDLCERLAAAEQRFLMGLRLDFVEYATKELPRRKQRLKVQSFDDLLSRLHAALAGAGGNRLASEIRAKYQAALIDEFQDTDPVQYQIFRRIFAPAGDREMAGHPPLLFLIGDPKQAIYGFRGADFFTYLDVARRERRRFTLGTNWRSEARLVSAVNTLFRRVPAPFVFDEILFNPVAAQGEADQAALRESGRRLPPLHLWFCPRGEDGKSISKERAEEALPRVVAAEISRLLNGDTRLGDRRVSPQDVAVLVLENKQAFLMQEALRALGIPSVLHTEASLFSSPEARELERVLLAAAQPGNERRIRAALATDLLGVNGAELENVAQDEAGWQARLERFQRYAALWSGRGFTAMFRDLLHEEEIRQRLLRLPDGERRLTNVLHLGEVLHHAAQERRLGPAGLRQWLGDQIASDKKAADEHQLRLERDDFAVRLVTIHKSKGLEYPIVFCPFSWKSSDLKRFGEEQTFFHERSADGDSQYIRDLDTGSPDYPEHREHAVREKLAENVRLLYVALTRARNRCYFVWGGFRNSGSSAPAWLLHRAPDSSGNLLESLNAHFDSLDDGVIRRQLRELVTDSAKDASGEPTVLLQDLPAADALPYHPPTTRVGEVQPRRFTGAIEREWRTTSFSGLASHHRDELPDHDAGEPAPPPVTELAPPGSIFAFPRGTKAGTCLHKILELADFEQTRSATLEKLVDEQLRLHGFDPKEFGEGVAGTVRRALATPLDPARSNFTLCNIPNRDRLNEVEFCFPIDHTTPEVLGETFAGFSPGLSRSLGRLDFDAVRGFLQGFIDLVFRFEGRFYVVDWKSNWLGNRAGDYDANALRAEMNDRFYPLQYHLYTLALHQHLKLRLPGYDYSTDFGGVYYLFLRGLDRERPELGVFHDRPSGELIERMETRLVVHPEIKA